MEYIIIGDVHGCYEELTLLLKKVQTKPCKDRNFVFLGDLTDRGPNSIGVIELVYKLVFEEKCAHYVPGNHCNKLYRFFLGRGVKQVHGLETTVAEYEQLTKARQQDVKSKFMKLYEESPLYRVLDSGMLVVAHAGIRQDYIGKTNKKVETFVLYGDITGKTLPDGRPVRRDWAQEYTGKATIVYGHTPVHEVRHVNNTYNIDTGCIFGGKLTALVYPSMEITSVPSQQPYLAEKFSGYH